MNSIYNIKDIFNIIDEYKIGIEESEKIKKYGYVKYIKNCMEQDNPIHQYKHILQYNLIDMCDLNLIILGDILDDVIIKTNIFYDKLFKEVQQNIYNYEE